MCFPVHRDTKEDYNRLHPPMVSASGLNPNLMVTGGPTLAGAGRWPADPSSHLASHPWLPRPGAPSMWLSGSPYGAHFSPPFFCVKIIILKIAFAPASFLNEKYIFLWGHSLELHNFILSTLNFPSGHTVGLPDVSRVLFGLSVLDILRNNQFPSLTTVQK